MGVGYNPKIVTNGLLLALDAANIKSYPNPGPRDHGISDWYCFVSGTATYSAVYPGTIIYENDSGSITTLISETSAPTRGTISVVAGRKYFANKPIHLLVESGLGGHCLAPMSLAGRYFGSVAVRNANGTFYMYSPFGTATVSVYDNVVGGVTGTATTTVTVNEGSTNTYTMSNLNTYIVFSSNLPIIMTTAQNGADAMIVPPASTNIYRRRASYQATINNTVPATSSIYYLSDSLPSFAIEIADGAGGDSSQGLGLENLSDTYSFGNSVSDYQIVAPYPNTTVEVSYWNGSSWIVGETHSLNGTITNPAAVDRDGTNGFGVDGTTISGAAAFLAGGANLWRWRGSKPFYLLINDTVDDEETLLGWMSNNEMRRISNENRTWFDLSGNDNSTLTNGPIFNSDNSGAISFDGVNDFSLGSSNITYGNNTSWEAWVNCEENVSAFNMFMGRYLPYFSFRLGNSLLFSNNIGGTQRTIQTATNLSLNTWYHAAFTNSYDGVNTTMKIYTNGVETATGTFAGTQSNYSLRFMVGDGNNFANSTWYPFKGRVSNVKVYNRTLTAAEVLQNFNALRGRFGI